MKEASSDRFAAVLVNGGQTASESTIGFPVYVTDCMYICS